MSTLRVEEPIVIHGPVTGLPEMLAGGPPLAPPTVTLPELQPSEAGQSSTAFKTETTPTTRASGLDAFRGLLLLAMNFAFTIPENGVYPNWMYHMQNPPPAGAFVNQPGLTWRDLLFGGFLFTMAAAIPVTMTLRLEKRVAESEIVWIAMRRGFLLFVFALLIGHVNPYWTGDYTKLGNVMAIGGFLLSFALFLRPRSDWNPVRFQWLRYSAWLGLLTLFAITPSLYGGSFSLSRRDDVIAAMAFSVLVGTVLWLATRTNARLRLVALAALLIVRVAAGQNTWASGLYNFSPAPALYEPWYLDLLFVVIPGTIVGDLLVGWMKSAPADSGVLAWSKPRLAAIAILLAALVPILCTGLYLRRVLLTTLVSFAVLAIGALITRSPKTQRDQFVANLYRAAAGCTFVGLLLDPLEGGIQKSPQNLSYLAVVTGLSCAVMLATVLVVDFLQSGRRWLKPLVEIGQNPLMAYVIYMLFITHLLYLVRMGGMLSNTWPQAVFRGLLFTATVGALVSVATRRRLLWRA